MADAMTNWRGEAGGQNKPGIGSYLESLMAAGVISPDRIYNTQDGNTLYLGNDGNIYFPTYRQTSSGSGENMALDPIDYSNPASVWRIPLSNIDPATGKDKLNSVTDFLDPTTGQMYDQGRAGFNQMRLEEKLVLGAIAAMADGAAMHGLGMAGGAAGDTALSGMDLAADGMATYGGGSGAASAGAAGAGGASGFGLTPSILPEAMTLTGGQTLAGGLPAVTEAGLFSNPAMWTGWGSIPQGLGYGLGATAGASFLPQALEGVPPPQLGPEGVPPPANPNLPGNSFPKIPGLPGSGDGGFDWTSLIGPGLSAVGGIAGAKAADKAADTQAQAARDALGLQREMFNKTVELQEPFRQNGIAAGNRMLQVLGIGGDPNAADYNMMNRRFTADDLYADPSYNFRLSEGQKVLERSRAAKGGYFSGATGKALTRYGQDYASTEYGKAWDRNEANKTNTFNRYASLYGSGQTAANTTGAAGQNFGNAGANLITQGGDARAAGVVGQANAFTDAITNGWRAYQSSQNRQYENALLDRILSRA